MEWNTDLLSLISEQLIVGGLTSELGFLNEVVLTYTGVFQIITSSPRLFRKEREN